MGGTVLKHPWTKCPCPWVGASSPIGLVWIYTSYIAGAGPSKLCSSNRSRTAWGQRLHQGSIPLPEPAQSYRHYSICV